MSGSLLIRDVPPDIRGWIDAEREARLMSQREFVLSVLAKVYQRRSSEPLLFEQPAPPAPQPSAIPEGLPFSFVDLFAGIGGLRIGLERCGGRCVYSCEWDRNAQKTYRAWFGETPDGDIREVRPRDIPDHDILAAGFPCQPFSIAGVSKKKSLGRPHGFKDATQGTLFFHLATIINAKRPPVFLLENVKNLQSHDKGRTWQVIRSTLEEMKYLIFTKVIDAASWVPQHRERVFIVGFDRRIFGDDVPFEFPTPPTAREPRLRDILEPNPPPKYTLTDHLWKYLRNYAAKHKAAGNGFGFGMATLDGVTRTLSARYYKDGSEILIPQPSKNPRRLTPRECARLMGFEDHRPIVVSDMQAYKQYSQASCCPGGDAVAKQFVRVLSWQLSRFSSGRLLKRQRFAEHFHEPTELESGSTYQSAVSLLSTSVWSYGPSQSGGRCARGCNRPHPVGGGPQTRQLCKPRPGTASARRRWDGKHVRPGSRHLGGVLRQVGIAGRQLGRTRANRRRPSAVAQGRRAASLTGRSNGNFARGGTATWAVVLSRIGHCGARWKVLYHRHRQ